MECQWNLKSEFTEKYCVMIEDLEFCIKDEMAMMGWLSEIVRVWEYDVMVGEGQLYIIFIDRENIAKDGPLEFLEERAHAW